MKWTLFIVHKIEHLLSIRTDFLQHFTRPRLLKLELVESTLWKSHSDTKLGAVEELMGNQSTIFRLKEKRIVVGNKKR